MADELGADALLLLTDADAVMRDYGTPNAAEIRMARAGELDHEDFDPGSMGPKIEAANQFVSETGGIAGIGRLEDAEDILAGRAGTTIS